MKQNDHVSDYVNDHVKLTVSEKRIFELIKKNPYITYSDIVDELHISVATIRRSIKKLRIINYIIRHGSDKLGYWKVIKK